MKPYLFRIQSQRQLWKPSWHTGSQGSGYRQLLPPTAVQFTSVLFKKLTDIFGIIHRPTTSYNPKGNGKIERVHRVLKTALRCKYLQDWVIAFPFILLGICTSVHDNGYSPAEMAYGTSLRLLCDIFNEPPSQEDTSEIIAKAHFAQNCAQPAKDKHS